MFYEPPHDRGHRLLTGWVTGPELRPERVGHDGQCNDYRSGPVWRGHGDRADDLLSRMRADDAGVPARCGLVNCDLKRRQVRS